MSTLERPGEGRTSRPAGSLGVSHQSWAGKNKISPPSLIVSSISCCVLPLQCHLLGTLGIQSLIQTSPPSEKSKLHSEGRHSRCMPASGGPGAHFPACGMQRGDQGTAHPFPAQRAAHSPATLPMPCSLPFSISSSYFLFLNSQIES